MAAKVAARSTNSLCLAIKASVQKGDTSKAQSESHYIRAGKDLILLKDRWGKEKSKDRLPWHEYVRKHCDLGRTRADELMKLAEGLVTAEVLRANTGARTKKARAKSKASGEQLPLRSGSSPRPSKFQDPRKIDTCDYDPGDTRPIESEPYRVTRLRGHLGSVRLAIEAAERNLFMRNNTADWAKLDPEEITDEVIAAAQSVVDAWLNVVHTLKQRKQGNGSPTHDGKDNSKAAKGAPGSPTQENPQAREKAVRSSLH